MSFFGEITEAYKSHHIINDFLFPGSSKTAYGWDTFKQDELICLSTGGADNLIIPCLLLRGRSARPSKDGEEKRHQHASTLLIYCHANSEDLGSIYPCAQWLCQMMGVHVLVPEYPGYGLCTGNPCEDTVNRAVLAACTFAKDALRWDLDHILIYGRSIGTGPALNAARLGRVGGLVLVSPYTNIRDIIETHVGSVIALIAAGASDWDNRSMIRNVAVPILLIHGTADDIIPCNHSEELHELCQAPKRLVLLERVGHQDMDLLYALVHASPDMFPLLDLPRAIDLSTVAPLISGSKGPTAVPVFNLSNLDDPAQASPWGSNAGEMFIGGRNVFVL
uniref:Serine aminopeptidase S33 domain-containing protein n=1 Tax=Cryptomonas curvata TaxID=233186 RepID=A0A7S0N4J5_9CRYP